MESVRSLVERSLRNDAEAFAALIRAFERTALSVAFGLVPDANAAGEVVQDAFVRAWERLGDLREPDRFAPWLCGIVRHLALDRIRRRRNFEPLEEAGCRADPRWTSDPLEEIGQREMLDRIGRAIEALDEVTRPVLVLKYYQDLSSREIGDLMGLSPAAVDMRLTRARKQLRVLLADQPRTPNAIVENTRGLP